MAITSIKNVRKVFTVGAGNIVGETFVQTIENTDEYEHYNECKFMFSAYALIRVKEKKERRKELRQFTNFNLRVNIYFFSNTCLPTLLFRKI